MKVLIGFVICILVSVACNKKSEADLPSANNLPPSVFEITIADLKQKSVSLNWTESKDPEGKQVVYSVVVGSDTIKLNSERHIELNNLEENKKYDVSVLAMDPEGAKTKQTVSFNTTEYSIPSAFDVSIIQIGGSIASIAWTSSSLPDNSPLQYDFYLNDSLIQGNLPDTSKGIYLKGLKEFTSYTVKVIAKSLFNKTQQSIKQFTTVEDPKPTGLGIQVKVVSYSILKFSVDPANDIEGQNIRYSVLLDDIDISSQLESTVMPGKEYTLRSLTPLKTYKLLVIATDDGGKIINKENTFVTLKQPILVITNKTITKTADGFVYNLETNVDYKPGKIILYANGIAITAQRQVSAIIGGNTISYTYPNTVLPSDGAYNIAANLFWGDDTEMSRTATFNAYSFYNFVPTSAAISEAKIDAGSSYKTYFIYFQNSIISPNPGYSIVEVVFGTQNVGISIFRTGETTGYLTGFASTQFSLIDAGPRTGYVIMKDREGYHKLSFTFSYY
jgi:hypothetical protein